MPKSSMHAGFLEPGGLSGALTDPQATDLFPHPLHRSPGEQLPSDLLSTGRRHSSRWQPVHHRCSLIFQKRPHWALKGTCSALSVACADSPHPHQSLVHSLCPLFVVPFPPFPVLLNNNSTLKSNPKLIKWISLRVRLWPECQYISGKERKLKLTSVDLIWITSAARQKSPSSETVFGVNGKKPRGL